MNGMAVNQQYIDGSWYENQYAHGAYRAMYIDQVEPEWAVQCDDYVVQLIAMVLGLQKYAAILDCGAGVGQIMNAWRRQGYYNVHGIELSLTAVAWSYDPDIILGNVADMGMFKDGEFDLVCSIALLEHIDKSMEDAVIREMIRVGGMQAHMMAQEEGSDPSHLNIKTAAAWGNSFMGHDRTIACSVIRGPLLDDDLLIGVRPAHVTAYYPLYKAFERTFQKVEEQ